MADDIASQWRVPGFDPATDTLLVLDADHLVAQAEVHAGRADALVHPAWRGRGLGSSILDWTERRAREQGATRLGQTISDRATDAVALLTSRGYAPTYSSWVLRLPPGADLAVGALPDRVELDVVDPHRYRAAYEVVERAFGEWEGREPRPEDAWRSQTVERAGFDPELLIGAFVDGRLVGVVFAIDYPDEGWIDQLAVETSWRGCGLGRALLATAFDRLRARGHERLGLNTDSRTGALDLYRRVGMRVELSFTHLSRGLTPAR